MTATETAATFVTRSIRALANSRSATVDGIAVTKLINASTGRANLVMLAECESDGATLRAVASYMNGLADGCATIEITTPADDADLDETETIVRIDLDTIASRHAA
jgi:hypothetical protein